MYKDMIMAFVAFFDLVTDRVSMLLDLLDRLGDEGSLDDLSCGRKNVVGGDGCGKGVASGGNSIGMVNAGSVRVRKTGMSNGKAGMSNGKAGRKGNLGTSGHEDGSKDNELIHGDMWSCVRIALKRTVPM